MKRFDRSKYLNIKQLKERGWTNQKIDLWLKEPDLIIKNPVFKTAAPSKLYLLKRVKQQEKNKRFQEWLKNSKSKRAKLSESLKKKNEEKRKELIDYINSIPIKIKKMPLDKLREKAVEHYNMLWLYRGRDDKFATINDDEKFLNRICVNMLRHEFSDYEYELDRMFGQVGKDEGYALLKQRINDRIYELYPELKNQ